MATSSKISRWADANQTILFANAVAVLVVGLSIWVGLRARAAASALVARRATWEVSAGELATVQQQFKAPNARESAALIAESSRMSALGVPAEERLNLVDMIGRLAEACALEAVRVNAVAASDSTVVPERQVFGNAVKPASYAIAVEFAGSFANAQKFVSSLPPSVAVSRLIAARQRSGAIYQLILSVYETDANSGD
jgi:hypothetical protein